MKKYLIAVLAAFLVLALTGCGGQDSPKSPEHTEGSQTDCCKSSAALEAPESESVVPDCCGE